MNVDYLRPLAGGSESESSLLRIRQQPSRRVLRIRLHVALVALDALCIVGSYFVAGLVYRHGGASDHWLTIVSAILPIYLFSAFGARAYAVDVIQDVNKGVGRAIRSLIIAAAAVLFIAFYLRASEEFSRAIFAIGIGFSAVLLTIARAYFAKGATSILGGNPYTVVVITDDPAVLASQDFSIAIPASSFDPAAQDPAMYDRLATALKSADRVIVGCAPELRGAWVHALKGANIQAEMLAPELAAIRPMMVAQFGGMPTLVVARGPLNLPDRLVKRGFDLALAVGALILLAPLLAVTALLIKLGSPGPVLFVQTRIGRSNRMFRMYKFRSMRVETLDGHGHTSTARDDDRITFIGRIIRRTSIDELPQIINVLIGDMSIVGPRPHALGSRAEDQLFWEIDERYWHRHAAKPGLTGLAQVRGYRGATNFRADLVNRLHADLEYLNNWSIWRDVKIILLTFRVLMHKNAF